MEDDWDLQAVVRGCTTTSAASTTTTRSFMTDLIKPRSSWFSPSLSIKQDESLLCFPDSFDTRNAIEELHELYKPFFPKSQPLSSLGGGSKDQSQQQQQQQSKQFCGAFVTTAATASTSATTTITHSQTASRSKRRKTQQKKVCQVPAEGLSSDTWSWRKYGQKPIKGSPYPRGYYRCSSSKGCLARKQVERNRSDPTMFIITYTAEHNHPAPTHRNSLAGTTRHQKPLTPQQPSSPSSMAAEPNNNPSTKPSSSSSPTTSMEDDVLQHQQSIKVEIRVDGEEDNMVEDCDDEDELGFPDMAVTDDFFEGLDELAGPLTGDLFSDHLPASFSLPWMANNAAAAAGSS